MNNAITVDKANRFEQLRSGMLLSVLVVLLFSAGVNMVGLSIYNAERIWYHELTFIALFLSCHRPSAYTGWIRANRMFFILLLLWIGWCGWTTWTSPLELWDRYGRERFLETVTHVVFGLVLYAYLKIHRPDPWIFLGAICLSVVTVALGFMYECTFNKWSQGRLFEDPPFGAHIRHVGYHATLGVCILLCTLPMPLTKQRHTLSAVLGLVISLGFLLWMAGRSQFISICGIVFLLGLVHYHFKQSARRFLVQLLPLFLAAILLSELFAIYDSVGFLRMFDRLFGIGSAEGMTYGSGRLAIWEVTTHSIAEHPFLGHGAHAYLHMPNKLYGIQPHNVFLQCLLEWGIIGSLLFFSMLLMPLKKLALYVYHHWRERQPMSTSMLAALAIILALSAQALVDGTYFHGQPCFYLAFAFALALQQSSVAGD